MKKLQRKRQLARHKREGRRAWNRVIQVYGAYRVLEALERLRENDGSVWDF